MSTLSRPTTVTCTACQTTADLPENRDHRGLWNKGWRWIGRALMSCPACPPVVVVDEQGRHRHGPGSPRH